jgi:A/G-specific adenine glycosylase
MDNFSSRIIAWQEREGRHGLPWQGTRDPYCIWVSEIMLQQTQVATVIPYFERFMRRFPAIAALAGASQDEVMQHWAGLGYYARARNLHRAAIQVVEVHQGVFPTMFEDILALPGIGRSTAAAISAFAYGESRAILDGNVKRVFARHFGIEGDVRSKAVEDALWMKAEESLPPNGIERYTQGLMDLGAMLCVRGDAACLLCPVNATCQAFSQGRVEELPGKSARRETPHRQTRMLVLVAGGEVLLEKRPPTGIWGGLWSLPELPVELDPLKTARSRYGIKSRVLHELKPVDHGFSHYSLTIYPVQIAVSSRDLRAMEPGLVWLNLAEVKTAALPAPVKKILAALGK